MNDAIRERLSAYLDGALPDAERRALELELAGSDELRCELEALRAVSKAVKDLPREKLPAGFLARLESRRAREGAATEREYFILPPAYRPLAFALSTAVVALVVWDKTHSPEELLAPKVGWDGGNVAVKSAAEAPASIDVSARLSALNAGAKLEDETAEKPAVEAAAQPANKEDFDGGKLAASSTFGKHLNAPGKPVEIQEADGIGPVAGAGGAGLSVPSSPSAAPAAADALTAAEGKNGFLARSEEERSAINERLYQGFEEEKKRMGIAKIMDKDAEDPDLPSGGRELLALQATPEAPRLDRARTARSVGSVRGAARAKREAATVKALVLKSAEALQTAWAAAGLPGDPPAVKFPDEMAVFLAGPPGCGIASVQNRKKHIVVLYKDSGFDDASARVKAVPFSPKPVVVKPAQ